MSQSPERPVSGPFQTVTTKADSCIAGPVLAPFLTEHANSSTQRSFDAAEPLRTQCAQIKGGHFSVAAAHLTTLRGTSEAHLQGDDMAEALSTVTGQGTHHALIAAHLTHLTHQGGERANDPAQPLRTVTGAHRGEQALVSAYFEQANTGQQGRPASAPMSTITASGSHQQLVHAYLVKYYGEGGQWQGCAEPMHTVPTRDRIGLVQVVQVPKPVLSDELLASARRCAVFLHEHLPERFPELADLVLVGDHVLVDITLRMLAPRELARAQGFPADYVIERGADGRAITKTDQVRLIGNSVCPDVAEALIRANAADLINLYTRTAA